jgi:small subunit ribosomal protein S17
MSNVVDKVTRTLTGRVVSDKRQATRTVEVNWSRRHDIYGKVMKGRTILHIHDPHNESKTGDLVEIKQVRPISKTKNWQLVQILEKVQ